MPLITVSKIRFVELCQELKEEVEVSGYCADTIVAVARAGVYLAQEICGDNFYTVRCAREGTDWKHRWFGAIIKRLPDKVNIGLRKFEHRVLEWIDRSSGYKPRRIIMSGELEAHLKQGGRKVLIIDDAVDSGRSLKSVVDALRKINPDNELRTAVITVTRHNPVIDPDYALFRNRSLIRFPWAADMNER